jgi:hypothetical protein
MPNFGYGLKVEMQWFEKALGAFKDSSAFAFSMLELRGELEHEDGYYLQLQTIQDDETGLRKEVWQIPSAAEHETIAKQFEGKMRRYAHRAVSLRVLTLSNETAQLTDAERSKMETASRIAGTRLVLLKREKAITEFVSKNAPKMLK